MCFRSLGLHILFSMKNLFNKDAISKFHYWVFVSIFVHFAFVLLIIFISQYVKRKVVYERVQTFTLISQLPKAQDESQEPARAQAKTTENTRTNTTPEPTPTTDKPVEKIPENANLVPSQKQNDTLQSSGNPKISSGSTQGVQNGQSDATQGGRGGTGASRVSDASILDNTDFEPLYKIKPEYPPIARKAGIEGFVEADLVIDENGNVKECKVVRHTGHLSFVASCQKVLPLYRFPPPRIRGKKATIIYLYRITFSLD